MNKKNRLQKNLKWHCFKCQTIYQLLEVHSQIKPNCPENCCQQWQDLCHEYYKEKILAYLAIQEEAEEKERENSNSWPDWLKKPAK